MLKSLSSRNSETCIPDPCVVFNNRLSLLKISFHRSLLFKLEVTVGKGALHSQGVRHVAVLLSGTPEVSLNLGEPLGNTEALG